MTRTSAAVGGLVCLMVGGALLVMFDQVMDIATNDWLYPACSAWKGSCNPLLAGIVAGLLSLVVMAFIGYAVFYWQLTRRDPLHASWATKTERIAIIGLIIVAIVFCIATTV